MSLSSSLFTGTSGLTNMGNAMQVVGNNISNVNTVGFKKGRSTFADTLSQSVATQSGTDQVGRGMSIGAVDQSFDTGSFESTGNSTDLSIGGDGFFVVRQSNSENNFYTRAGNFHFDKSGQLVNPESYLVQGWALDEDTGEDIGAINDIVLNAFTSSPKQSSTVSMITNLDSDAESQTVVLSNSWDSGETTYMDSTNYEYQSVVKVYDALGSTHDVTVYYDKKTGTDWEYVVTCDPSEDNRNLVESTDSKGLLARGTISFSESSGDILKVTMEEFTGRIGNVQANGVNNEDAINFEIDNVERMALDGYGFEFEFDGTQWDFATEGLPAAYANAQILYSDDQTINLTLDNTLDLESDLRIKLDQPAVATDSFGFDINDPSGLHIQGIEGTTYLGDTANDNTTLEINAPETMTHDVSGVKIVWNPTTETWSWSDPGAAEDADSLVAAASILTSSTTAISETGNWDDDITFPDYSSMTLASSKISVVYDGFEWDWNASMKEADLTDESFMGIAPDPTPNIDITGVTGGVKQDEGDYKLTFNSVTSTWSATLDTFAFAGPVAGDGDSVTLTFASGATVKYEFLSTLTSTATISFEIDPSPPMEYSDAIIIAGTGADLGISFSGDSSADMLVAMNALMVGGDTFIFDVTPEEKPPKAYSTATLKGDKDKVVIDLDGSGNDDDKEDIVFRFADSLKFGPSTDSIADRSEITFDILGSTAWREQSVDEIDKTGYFAFNTDFLGGEFGSTEFSIELDIGTRYDGINFINDSLSSTQYARSSNTVYQDADGYSAGDLQGVDVASDGIMTGVYSNGQLIPLFRVGLAKFLNNNGLSNSGGNLFSETRDSGSAITNKPGENGLGTISPNSLEMSNVDISEEFVKMITTQRGFQANSKTITTVDEMMQTVINMK
ncbi:FlgE [Desulforapulum autotrophicum HRM2]|uniref:Flagellar hook protein FlgE n=1 Tax=Desulforapulum autotrophicum (strain ATCC 43914 / DSM 3382 / VKM B-1955 / HRM2) TaxID=177437 RepID=C0QAJ6_DESAH|nr:flagellar hook-basal body complex protein [Desulforapulum autotrophicum]ACN16779.1 FlgE [Desulforapulum autotrophicum HRM2]